MINNIQQLQELAFGSITQLPPIYHDRLKFEFEQLSVQGAEQRWITYYNNGDRFPSNPKNLLLPYVLGLLADPVDPLTVRTDEMLLSSNYNDVIAYVTKHGKLPSDMFRDSDVPDVDIDCLPDIRDELKDYATKRFSSSENLEDIAVCSVGTWQTYKFSSALADASEATGEAYRAVVQKITTKLPVDIDDIEPGGVAKCTGKIITDGQETECGTIHMFSKCPRCDSTETEKLTIGQALEQYEELATFCSRHPRALGYALRMIGKFRNTGKHAGALIVSDGPLFGHLPMLYNNGQWISFLSEGKNQELSKWGWIKYDVLGLKTIGYVYHACMAIQKNRDISFGEPQPVDGYDEMFLLDGIEYNDPEERIAGYYIQNGVKHWLSLDDPDAIALANNGKMNSVFQFDTPLAKCCAYDSLINTTSGTIPINKIDNKQHAIKYLSTVGEKSTYNYEVKRSGVKKVKTVKFGDGRVIKLTDEHKVLTLSGYKFVSDLMVGDEIIEI